MSIKKTDNRLEQSKKIVFRLLKYRAYSRKEITEKLRLKGFPDKIISTTLRYFKSSGIADDKIFAREWINARLNRQVGIRLIKFELGQKGVPDKIIKEEIKKANKDYDEQAALAAIASKQVKKYNNLGTRTMQRRLYGFLSRRGFEPESIEKVTSNLKVKNYERE